LFESSPLASSSYPIDTTVLPSSSKPLSYSAFGVALVIIV
jgi:hypothetical protein